MADYTLQYPGATIDALLAKVNSPDSSPTASSENLVKSGGVKSYVDGKTGDLSQLQTEAKSTLVAAINEAAQSGGGVYDISTQQDGSLVFLLRNGDTITVDLDHYHTQYPKYVYCASQEVYDAITEKESDTIYLIYGSPQSYNIVYCPSQAYYDAISPKDNNTLYVIAESE